MKILIGYDASPCSVAAIDDLKFAGLPESGVEATVLTVAEVWLPPDDADLPNTEEKNKYLENIVRKHRLKARHEVAEAEKSAREAAQRISRIFPSWEIQAEGSSGSPAWKIVSRANRMNADLIIVGSHGRTALSRVFLGSISQKVLTEAHCSVRVARGRIEIDDVPSRIIIGFDGTRGSQAAVNSVASRNWSKGSEVYLITVSDVITPTAVGQFIQPVVEWTKTETEIERNLLEKAASEHLKILTDKGLKTSLQIEQGNPKEVLVREAERRQADSIFVGANRYGSRVERFLLGSVSAAVAQRAHCSVEVVREAEKDESRI